MIIFIHLRHRVIIVSSNSIWNLEARPVRRAGEAHAMPRNGRPCRTPCRILRLIRELEYLCQQTTTMWASVSRLIKQRPGSRLSILNKRNCSIGRATGWLEQTGQHWLSVAHFTIMPHDGRRSEFYQSPRLHAADAIELSSRPGPYLQAV